MTGHQIGKKKRIKNTSYISQKFNFLQFCPVFPSFFQLSSVLLSFSSNFIEFHPVSPSFAQFCPVLPSFPQFLPVLPSLARSLASYFSFLILQRIFPLYSFLHFVHVFAVHVPTCPYHSGIAHFYKFTFIARCSFQSCVADISNNARHAANPTITRNPLCVPVFELISKNENNKPMLNQHTIAPVTKSIYKLHLKTFNTV